MHEAKDIEIIHIKICRWVSNVRKSTNLIGLYGELGRYFLPVHGKFTNFKYWVKLLKSDDVSQPEKIYLMLKNDADINNTYYGNDWAFQIKSLSNSLGLAYL